MTKTNQENVLGAVLLASFVMAIGFVAGYMISQSNGTVDAAEQTVTEQTVTDMEDWTHSLEEENQRLAIGLYELSQAIGDDCTVYEDLSWTCEDGSTGDAVPAQYEDSIWGWEE